MKPSAPVAGKKPPFPFSHARIARYTAASATSHGRSSTDALIDRAGNAMCQIIVNPNVPFDVTLKQFSRKVQQAGILGEARRRRHYETPQARRKRKMAAQLRKRKRVRFS